MPRPRKPTRLKVLQANPGHLSKSQLDLDREPQYKPAQRGALKPPTFLDAKGKAEWHRVAAELARIGLLQVVDRMALGCYCAAYSDLVKARQVIDKEGQTYTA